MEARSSPTLEYATCRFSLFSFSVLPHGFLKCRTLFTNLGSKYTDRHLFLSHVISGPPLFRQVKGIRIKEFVDSDNIGDNMEDKFEIGPLVKKKTIDVSFASKIHDVSIL
jgi:hypothetical protein